MITHASTWLLRRKWILAVAGLSVLVALWWAFRPEKLWINEKVNEPAPFASTSDPQPILTGRFEGKAQQTSGRATIYKRSGGEEYLRLSDLTTPNDPDVHVMLARSDDPSLAQDAVTVEFKGIDCGPLKTNQENQIYNLPTVPDLSKYDAVVIYGERSHVKFGLAKLEPF